MMPKIGLVGLAGEYEVGFAETPALVGKTEASLKALGYEVYKAACVMYDRQTVAAAAESFKGCEFDVLFVCVGTWSEDHHLLDLLEFYDKPVILRAFPAVDTGSLCGVHQICCVLKELGKACYYVYGPPDDEEALKEIAAIAKAVALSSSLRHVRVGTVGGRIKGMTEIAYDELEIKDRTGIRIVNLDEDELKLAFDSIAEEDGKRVWACAKKHAGKITASETHCIEAAKYYLAMKSLIGKYGLEGLCIKCYPGLMGKVCLGYSLLAEEGIVCGCEGDVNGTVAMKILYELTGAPVHNTDLLFPDPASNTILFSHCGSGGFSIADKKENIHFGPVRLANTGVCSLFPAKPGKVTLINLVGRRGTYRMAVMVGEAVECGMEFPGNPLKVRFEKDVLTACRWIAEEGIGHHWIAGYGDVSEELEYFCRLNGIKIRVRNG